MTKHVQSDDLSIAWTINASNDTWLLTEDATITVGMLPGSQYGISENFDVTGSKILVKGDVNATGPFAQAGIYLAGSGTDLHIFESSTVTGMSGIYSISSDAVILNEGELVGYGAAIYDINAHQVTNAGHITGQTGIYSSDADLVENSGKIEATTSGIFADGTKAKIVNLEGGVIESDDVGVRSDAAGTTSLVNNGKIVGDAFSVQDGSGRFVLVNHGKLIGDVDLGAGDDVFDNRGGIFAATVTGGLGDDVYKTSAPQLHIQEVFNGGADKVMSTSDFSLGGFVENLTLIGTADIDGQGNTLQNIMIGNKGDNRLLGGANHDILSGGAGKDVLKGGADGDTFYFRKNSDVEIVRDFQDGSDRLSVEFAYTTNDLNDLFAHHMQKKGDDVVITYGEDRLVIEDTKIAELTADDFILK
jgi:Ca2+-binding RTX toxin-like protein